MAFGLSLRKTPKPEIETRVNEAAQILGIENLLKRKPRQLSGGQRQRVALGRAIVREPAAFLLDEPLSNLDAKLRVQTRAELSKLHMRLGTTFIYVTHDQVEAMTMATRITVLNLGVLQQVGTPQELYDRPGNMFVAGFIGSPSMNFFSVTVNQDKDTLLMNAKGFQVPVPGAVQEKMKPTIGQKIVLGIRPEDIHMPEYTPSGILASPVQANVDVIEMMGNELYLHLVAEGDAFLARVDPRSRARPGQRIEVVFNMANMHAFEAESGTAIL
jgi:multiple sugar transport system ATP-binding protein